MSIRITKEDLEKVIKKEEYVKLTEKMTACILTTETGFEVIGISACANPENYVKELGEKYSREEAINKLWDYEGYKRQAELRGGK